MPLYTTILDLTHRQNMKFVLRGCMLASMAFMVLLTIKLNIDNHTKLRWKRGETDDILVEGTREEIQLRFHQLANTINMYFKTYLDKHQDLSGNDVRTGLIRHLTAHLNESLSTENMKQILTIVAKFIRESEKAETSEAVMEEISEDGGRQDVKLNLEVARGRLSEHFKVRINVE